MSCYYCKRDEKEKIIVCNFTNNIAMVTTNKLITHCAFNSAKQNLHRLKFHP